MTDRKAPSVETVSSDLVADSIERLKEIFPECVAEGKVDFEKLKDALGEIVDDRPERYSFTWAGKRDAIRLLQVPSRATLKPCRAESVEWETTKNVFIEGENLEVLKLLYKTYAGRVKMIYIDPPYNTGKDFIYPDNFADPLDTYLKLTGQKDSEGNLLTSNPETSGRFHSAWLSMIYPRLWLARQLLTQDGVILVNIDDKEASNLRLVMDQVFGEENFLAGVIWQKKYAPANDASDFSTSHDYIFVYAKARLYSKEGKLLSVLGREGRTQEMDSAYSNPDDDPRGEWKAGDYTCNKSAEERPNLYYAIIHPRTGEEVWPKRTRVWAYGKELHEEHVKEDRLWWGRNQENKVPAYKRFLSEVEGVVAQTIWRWEEVGHTDESKKEVKRLFGDAANFFDTPKPVRLIRKMLTLASANDKQDLVLDFFAGSGTTAHAVLDLNNADGGDRRFIMAQLPEPTSNSQFPTIAEIGKERIRRVIRKLRNENEGKLALENRQTPEDLGFRVFKLAESNYRQWAGVEERDGKTYLENMELFTDPLLPGWKPEDIVWEVALKEGYSLASTVEELRGADGNKVFRVTDTDLGQSFHICLDDPLREGTIQGLGLGKEDLFVCRDAALTDEQAANLALQCGLKTI